MGIYNLESKGDLNVTQHHKRSHQRVRTFEKPTIESKSTQELAIIAAQVADSKKAQDIVILNVGPVLAITDLFVVATGTSDRHVRTVAEEIEDKLKHLYSRVPLRVEGINDARWILLDYGDFIVHVFLEEARNYYDLERLWSDVGTISWHEAEPIV